MILKDPPNILVYILHIKDDHLQTPYLNHNSDDQRQHIPAPWLVLSALKYLIISLPYDTDSGFRQSRILAKTIPFSKTEQLLELDLTQMIYLVMPKSANK